MENALEETYEDDSKTTSTHSKTASTHSNVAGSEKFPRMRFWTAGETLCFRSNAGDNIHAGENTQSRRKHTGAADGEGSWEGGREGVAGGKEGGHRFWERLLGRRVSGSGLVGEDLFSGRLVPVSSLST